MTSPSPDLLQVAREALQRHAWDEAYEALADADRDGPLTAEGLLLLADAAEFALHSDELLEVLERAYGAFLAEGDRSAAAMMAYRLAELHFRRMSVPMVGAWIGRAETLAAEDPGFPVHGYLTLMRGGMAVDMMGDVAGSIALFEQAMRIADRIGDRDLRARSLQEKGRALVLDGKLREGLALVDEAMVAAVGGELGITTTGIVYCGTIYLCSHLGDYRRASEWTDATLRWCERQSIPTFAGICRIHRAELLRLHGSLTEAEHEAQRAREELPLANFQFATGLASYEIGETRRRMGDVAGAEDAYGRADEEGFDPEPGRSLLRLAQGKTTAAAAGVRRALADDRKNELTKLRLLLAQAEIAVAAGDLETADAASQRIDSILGGYEATALHAAAARVRGALRLAQGDGEGALSEFRRAREGWQEVDAPYEVAEARVLLARAFQTLGDEDAAVQELRAARAAFERLGARLAVESTGALLGEIASSAEAPERVSRTFMFTDIVKSTDLVSVIGDEAWEGLLGWHDQTLRSLFAAHRGEVVHHTGDGFFVAFDDARSALTAAVAVQRALAEHRQAHGFAPLVRIGVHAAEATRRGQDYSGGEVHKAARIAAAAGASEILASTETIAEAANGFTVSESREIAAKGIPEPVGVATVEWRTPVVRDARP